MVLVSVILIAPLVLAGLTTLYGLARAGSATEFFDRPLCWVLGHPSPGSAMRFLTEHKTPMGTLPAEVWHCNRCGHMVTLVGPHMRGES